MNLLFKILPKRRKNKKYMRADLKSKRLETLISNLEQIFFKYHQVLSWWVLQITVFKEMRWFCLNALENKRKIRNLFNKSISKNEIIRIYIEKNQQCTVHFLNSALLILRPRVHGRQRGKTTVYCWQSTVAFFGQRIVFETRWAKNWSKNP